MSLRRRRRVYEFTTGTTAIGLGFEDSHIYTQCLYLYTTFACLDGTIILCSTRTYPKLPRQKVIMILEIADRGPPDAALFWEARGRLERLGVCG